MNGVAKVIANKFKLVLLGKNKGRISLKNITEDIIKNMEDAKQLYNLINSIPKSDMQNIYRNYLANINTYSGVKNYYKLYMSRMGSKAKSIEEKQIFGSMVYTLQKSILLLELIIKNINYIFEDDEITIENLKMSPLIILAIIKNIESTIDWINDYIILVITISDKQQLDMTKYNLEKLENICIPVATFINSLIDTNGYQSVINDIKRIRKESQDIRFHITIEQNNFSLNGVISEVSNVLDAGFLFILKILEKVDGLIAIPLSVLLMGILPILKLFRSIPAHYEEYRHVQWQRRKSTKLFLQHTIARNEQLKLYKDPNDPEYIKIQKIINSYEAMINGIDKKIYAYEKEVMDI